MKVSLFILQGTDGKWFIRSPGYEDYGAFATADDAWSWADDNIDDQFSGRPNWIADELRTPIQQKGPGNDAE